MPRFFLHLRDGTDEVLDEDGREIADIETLRGIVLAEARHILGSDLQKGGVIDLRYRIDAEEPGGNIAYSLPFKHAVNVISEG